MTKAYTTSSYAILHEIYGLGNILGIQKVEVGRTDIVWSCTNPEYVGPIILPHDDVGLMTTTDAKASSASGSGSMQHRIAVEVVCCANATLIKRNFSLSKGVEESNEQQQQHHSMSSMGNGERHVVVTSENETNIRKGQSLGCAFFDVDQIWNSTSGVASATLPGTNTIIHIHIARDSVLLPMPSSSPLLPPPSPSNTVVSTINSSSALYNNIITSSPKLSLQIRGIKMSDKTRNSITLTRPNFYYEIHRKVRDANGHMWALIYRSKRCMETLNPLWPSLYLSLYPHLNYCSFLEKSVEEEEEDVSKERFENLDIRITIYDSSSGISSCSSFSPQSSSSSESPSTTTALRKRPLMMKSNGSTLLGTVSTTLQSLLSLSCKGGCNISLNQTLEIKKTNTSTMKRMSRGQLVIVNAELIKTKKYSNATTATAPPFAMSSSSSLPPPMRMMKHKEIPLHSSAPPMFANMAIREGNVSSSSSSSVATASQLSYTSRKITSFDEYIQNGHKIELCVAIDFTDNNGSDWNTSDNIHYHSSSLDGGGDDDDHTVHSWTPSVIGGTRRMNNYEFVLSTIGTVVSKLNNSNGSGSDDRINNMKKNGGEIDIPVWGFGAEFEHRQYHIFQCGNVTKTAATRQCGEEERANNENDRKKAIVNHLLSTYHDTFECYPKLGSAIESNGGDGGGVVFDGIIRAAISNANKRKKYTEQNYIGKLSYTLLVVLTTGSYEDVIKCKERLVDASLKSPMSIIFINVGCVGDRCGDGGNSDDSVENGFQTLQPNGDFLREEYFLKQQQQQASGLAAGALKRRSFVTFVEGKDWNIPNRDAKALAKKAFEYVPEQVVEYFNLE